MATFPAVRALALLIWLLFLGCFCRSSDAQILPFAPFSPTETKQCQDFSARVEAYSADYNAQHEKCLAENKADRAEETHNSSLCSRSRCQYLHDYLYGDSPLSAKSEQKEVLACYSKLREYQAEKARKEKEQAEQEARDKQEEIDEATRRKKERDDRHASAQHEELDRAAREEADRKALELAQKGESERIASQQNQGSVTRQAGSPQKTILSDANSRQTSVPSPSLVDPFKDSASIKSKDQEIASNSSLVDPFASKQTLADPFPTSLPSISDHHKQEETWEGAKGVFEGFVARASNSLEENLNRARKELSPSDFRKFEHSLSDARSFIGGLDKTITRVKYTEDIQKILENPHASDNYHDIISDGASHGLSYTLKRLSPDFLSKIWEGPPGWIASITFDSSSTQTPKQDFDPMTALNNPSQYTFQQREAALQSLYQSAQKHPEIWDQGRFQWLYRVSEQLYNSPDNPNIHPTPP